jgi:hypothetical protein
LCSFFNLDASWGWVVNAPEGRNAVMRIVHEAGWTPEQVSTGAENLAPTGIQFLDRPARSESLYSHASLDDGDMF